MLHLHKMDIEINDCRPIKNTNQLEEIKRITNNELSS